MKMFLIQIIIMTTSFYVYSQNRNEPMPEMGGGNFHPNYENYKSDKFIQGSAANYSGDLTFSIPLITVPGRHGHNFDIKLTYNSNIHQNQFASWVGLGWNLNIGQIERTVNGRTDEPTQLSGSNLGPTPTSRGNLGGRLKPDFMSDDTLNRDIVDQYSITIDGNTLEMSPFAASANEEITLTEPFSYNYTFLTQPYNPWRIWGFSGADGGFSVFQVTKEDGAKYLFGGMDYGTTEYKKGVDNSPDHQSCNLPYRWNLTEILYPDGSKTNISYSMQNNINNRYYRRYSSVMIDRSFTLLNIMGNLFGNTPCGQCPQTDYVLFTYAHPDSLFTDTHYLVFKTSSNITDSTDRNCRLDTLILYERGSNAELKRISFDYATTNSTNPYWPITGGVCPPWEDDEKLNNGQLTLTKFTIENGNTIIPNQILGNNANHQEYTLSYTTNPKMDFELNSATPYSNNHWPGYFKQDSLAFAWRLKTLTLPTGGTYTYNYEILGDIYYDPEGNVASFPYPWNYSSEPRCRIKRTSINNKLDAYPQTWNYTYSDEIVYDPPSNVNQLSYVTNLFRYGWIGIIDEYFKYYRNCTVGHRWVQITNPDGSWDKYYYTSSFQNAATNSPTPFDPLESQPDSIYEATSWPPPGNIYIKSYSGKRGLIWKVESGKEIIKKTTLNYYSYIAQGSVKDRYDYYMMLNNNNAAKVDVRKISLWQRLDSTVVTKEGVNYTTFYNYNNTPRNLTGPGNGQLRGENIKNESNYKIKAYRYACEDIPSMNWEDNSEWMLNQISGTKISDGQLGIALSNEIISWENISNHWLQRAKYIWNGSPEDNSPPSDTNNVNMLRSEYYIYDNYGYSDIVSMMDANNEVTQYFYSDSVNEPYINTQAGLNKGQVTGIQKAQSSPLLRSSFKYDQYGNITAKTDENGNTTQAEYDDLGRIINVRNPLNQLTHHFQYYLSNDLSTTDPNYISDYMYRSQNDFTLARRVYDGIGNERQQLLSNNDLDIIKAVTYDNMGRISKSYKAYEVNLGTNAHKYDPSFHVNDTSYYHSPYVYNQNDYYSDGINRIKNIHGEINRDNHYKHIEYGTNSADEVVTYPPNTLFKTTYFDENNDYSNPASYKIKKMEFLNILGHKVKTVSDSGGLCLSTNYKYDVMGRIIGVALPSNPPTYFQGDTSKTFSYPDTTGILPINAIMESGKRYVQIKLHSLSYCLPNMGVDGVKDLIGPTVYFKIKEYQNGNLIHQSTVYSLYCTAMKRSESILYSVDTLATQVQLAVTGIDYPCEENSIEVKFVYISTFDDPTTEYVYNKRGLLYEKTSIDAGKVKFIYDKTGNARFSMDANQSSHNRFTYNKYDAINRLIETGEYSDSTGFTQTNANDINFPLDSNPYKIVDKKFIFDGTGYSNQRNTKGKLAKACVYKQANLQMTTQYSYNDAGQIEWIAQQFPGMQDIMISYWYDYQGNIVKKFMADTLNGSVYTFYEYDTAGRLSKVYTNSSDTTFGRIQQAEYTYFADGTKKRLQLGHAQGMDYRYNERGWLTQINHQNLNSSQDPGHDGSNGIPVDKFGEIIGYNVQNQIAAGTGFTFQQQWNGNISWVMTHTAGIKAPNTNYELVGFVYNYDNADRITKADFGYYNGTWDNSLPYASMYDIPSIGYDVNGNITSMQRKGSNALMQDNFAYAYQPYTNRLASITNTASGTQMYNYSYDSNGNITSDQMRDISNITYNINNLPEQLTNSENDVMHYAYDVNGKRIRKQGGTIDEYYIIGADGQTEAVYDAAGTAKFYNIISGGENIGRFLPPHTVNLSLSNIVLTGDYNALNSITAENGAEVNGTATLMAGTTIYLKPGFTAHSGCNFTASVGIVPNNSDNFYYLKDHLGSIRATVDSLGQICTYDDYDAWGLQLNGRSGNLGFTDDKYKFTGKERDVETGYDYFGARYYDSRIGRWMTIDPLADKYPGINPYNYTLNNPLKLVDPLGMAAASANPNIANDDKNKKQKHETRSMVGGVSMEARVQYLIPTASVGVGLYTQNLESYDLNLTFSFGAGGGFGLVGSVNEEYYPNANLSDLQGLSVAGGGYYSEGIGYAISVSVNKDGVVGLQSGTGSPMSAGVGFGGYGEARYTFNLATVDLKAVGSIIKSTFTGAGNILKNFWNGFKNTLIKKATRHYDYGD